MTTKLSGWAMLLVIAGLGMAPTPVAAQQETIGAQLIARGAPTDFADRVDQIISAARADALPTGPLESKALEGWAKRGRVSQDRVLAVLDQLRGRLERGRDVLREGGLDPMGPVIAGAAEALGRGLDPAQVREIVQSAPDSPAAATGLTVASSLAAQGLPVAAAARAVSDAYRNGRKPEEILEFPSSVADATARGERLGDIGQRIMQGGMLAPPGGGAGGQGGRPPEVPGSKQGTKSQTNKP